MRPDLLHVAIASNLTSAAVLPAASRRKSHAGVLLEWSAFADGAIQDGKRAKLAILVIKGPCWSWGRVDPRV